MVNVHNSKRTQYDSDFRSRAISLALSTSQPVEKTASDLGIKSSTLYNWVCEHKKRLMKHNPEEGQNVYDELTRLRKENARLKEERDILKKAAQYFAKESK